MVKCFYRVFYLFVAASVLFLTACTGGSEEGSVTVLAAAPTLASTAVPIILPTTKTVVPPTPTLTPTVTPSATETPPPTETAVPTPIPIDRTCPAEPPQKPEYRRYLLSPEPWPTPDPARSEAHFWLAKPLPPDQPLALNPAYPYGSDSNGRYLLHNGLDSLADKGTPVLAAADGVVVYAGPDAEILYGWRCNWYGQLVVIEHDERWQGLPVYSLYGHVLEVVVETGQRVAQGDPVASVGLGGVATNPHLHWEVRVGSNTFGSTRNPLLWLDPGPQRGVLAGRLVDPEKRPWQGVTVTLIDGSGEEVAFINTWTYLDDPEHLIKPDEGLAENFVFGDLAPGNYELFTKIQGIEYRRPVEIVGGELAVVEIITEPFMTPTPEAETND
jgi:murein DD-endopeptidase MepM/ murein hydrolase activator NlpD